MTLYYNESGYPQIYGRPVRVKEFWFNILVKAMPI